jgi:hypothetical protein
VTSHVLAVFLAAAAASAPAVLTAQQPYTRTSALGLEDRHDASRRQTHRARRRGRCRDPYHNADHNACPGHGPNQKHSLDKEASQLWLDPAATPRRVKVCTAYASPAAKASFIDSLFAFLR